LSLKDINSFHALDDFMFENEVDIRCKESGLSAIFVEPTEEGENLSVVLSDGSQLEMPPGRLDDFLEIVPLIKQAKHA